MNFKQKATHERAMVAARRYKKAEFEMIQVLQDADSVRLYKYFQLPSLFQYAVKYLKLSDPLALAFIAVARKSAQVPGLQQALKNGVLSVSSANRIVSTLT